MNNQNGNQMRMFGPGTQGTLGAPSHMPTNQNNQNGNFGQFNTFYGAHPVYNAYLPPPIFGAALFGPRMTFVGPDGKNALVNNYRDNINAGNQITINNSMDSFAHAQEKAMQNSFINCIKNLTGKDENPLREVFLKSPSEKNIPEDCRELPNNNNDNNTQTQLIVEKNNKIFTDHAQSNINKSNYFHQFPQQNYTHAQYQNYPIPNYPQFPAPHYPQPHYITNYPPVYQNYNQNFAHGNYNQTFPSNSNTKIAQERNSEFVNLFSNSKEISKDVSKNNTKDNSPTDSAREKLEKNEKLTKSELSAQFETIFASKSSAHAQNDTKITTSTVIDEKVIAQNQFIEKISENKRKIEKTTAQSQNESNKIQNKTQNITKTKINERITDKNDKFTDKLTDKLTDKTEKDKKIITITEKTSELSLTKITENISDKSSQKNVTKISDVTQITQTKNIVTISTNLTAQNQKIKQKSTDINNSNIHTCAQKINISDIDNINEEVKSSQPEILVGSIVNNRRKYSIDELMRAKSFESTRNTQIKIPKTENNRLFLKSERSEKVVYKRSKNAWVSSEERLKTMTTDQLQLEKCKMQIQRAINKFSKNTESIVVNEITKIPIKNLEIIQFLTDCIFKSVVTNSTYVSEFAHLCNFLNKHFSTESNTFVEIITEKFMSNTHLSTNWLENYACVKNRKFSTVEELDRINEELQILEQQIRLILNGSAKFIANLYCACLISTKIFEKFITGIKLLKHDLEMEMICAFADVLIKNPDKIQNCSKKTVSELIKFIRDAQDNYPMRVQFVITEILDKHDKAVKSSKVTITNINSTDSAKNISMKPDSRVQQRMRNQNTSGNVSGSVFNTFSAHINSNNPDKPRTNYFGVKKSQSDKIESKLYFKTENKGESRNEPKTTDKYNRNDKNISKSTHAQSTSSISNYKDLNQSKSTTHTQTNVSCINNNSNTDDKKLDETSLKKADIAIEELIGRFSTDFEAEKFSDELKDYELSNHMRYFIQKSFNLFVVKSKINHLYFGNLLCLMVRQGRLETSDILAGLSDFLNDFDESFEDFPKLNECIAKVLLKPILLDIIKIDEIINLFVEKGAFVTEKCVLGLFNVLAIFTSSGILGKYWKLVKIDDDLRNSILETSLVVKDSLNEYNKGAKLSLSIENTWDHSIRINTEIIHPDSPLWNQKYNLFLNEFFNLFFFTIPMAREELTENAVQKAISNQMAFIKILLSDEKRIGIAFQRLNDLQKSPYGYPPYLLSYIIKLLVKSKILELKTVEQFVGKIENKVVQEEFKFFKTSLT